MLEVTELAAKNLRDYCQQNDVAANIRVAKMGGCSGPSLGLALDERQATDTTVELDGLLVMVDNQLLAECGTVKVDFREQQGSCCGGGGGGFEVTTTIPLAGSGGGCGSSCGSKGGGCGC